MIGLPDALGPRDAADEAARRTPLLAPFKKYAPANSAPNIADGPSEAAMGCVPVMLRERPAGSALGGLYGPNAEPALARIAAGGLDTSMLDGGMGGGVGGIGCGGSLDAESTIAELRSQAAGACHSHPNDGRIIAVRRAAQMALNLNLSERRVVAQVTQWEAINTELYGMAVGTLDATANALAAEAED